MKFIKKLIKGIGFLIIILILTNIFGSKGTDNKEAETKPVEVVENVETKEESKLDDNVSSEFEAAFKQGQEYAEVQHMSKKEIYDILISEYGGEYPADAAQYAIDNLGVDWNNNALKKAEDYAKTLNLSRKAIYDQLIDKHGDKFELDQAQYAIDNVDWDFKENALLEAKDYRELMNMSNDQIFDQLTSENGGKFTSEEATYAVENLK